MAAPGASPQVVLITGCSSGLGRALAYELHARADGGAKAYRIFASARKLASIERLREAGMDTLQLDVTSDESVAAALLALLAVTGGRLDAVVNNSGVNLPGPVTEQGLAEMQRVHDTNVWGPVRVVQQAAPIMIRQRRGLVVNVGSITSQLATPFAGAYGSSKAALASLTASLAMELAPFGVRVMCVEAGSIRSALSDNAAAQCDLRRYASPASAYQKVAASVKDRVYASQLDSRCVPAEAAARQVVAAMRRHPPPYRVRVGGNTLLYSLLGFLQTWVCPQWVFLLLRRQFGLRGEL